MCVEGEWKKKSYLNRSARSLGPTTATGNGIIRPFTRSRALAPHYYTQRFRDMCTEIQYDDDSVTSVGRGIAGRTNSRVSDCRDDSSHDAFKCNRNDDATERRYAWSRKQSGRVFTDPIRVPTVPIVDFNRHIATPYTQWPI